MKTALVKVQQSQIHRFTADIVDEKGSITDTKDVVQFDVRFPEYPESPTYGLRIDFPITVQKIKDVIKSKAQRAKAQMQADEAIRSQLDDVLEFEVDAE